MDFNVTFSIPNGNSMTARRVINAWKRNAWELADIEHVNIQARTPEDTGTLIESLESQTGTGDTLVQVYTDPGVQLAGPWHRVYAQYQEGPPLGTETYTNGPHHMFLDALTEDVGEICAWAEMTGNIGVAEMVAEAESGAVTE